MADELTACPACGRLTLAREGAGEVCGACGWQDAAALRSEPDRPGAGLVTLNEARRNVAEFGLAYPPSEVGGQ